jgi:hypothetical protein
MMYEDVMYWDDNKLREMLELNNRKLQAYRDLLIDVDTNEKEEEYKREIEKIKTLINIIKIEQGGRFLHQNGSIAVASINNSASSNMGDDI